MQTYTNWEAWCINDASTDNSLKVLERFAAADSRIKHLSQSNSGPGAARQNGLKKASGKYIMFLDSDDWYAPEMCGKMVAAMENNDIDMASCQTKVVDESTVMLGRSEQEKAYYKNPYSGIIEISEDNIFKTNGVIWNKIFRKDIIDKYGLGFSNAFSGEDVAFSYLYKFVSKKALFIDEELYFYFRNETSLVSRLGQKDERFIGRYLDGMSKNAEYLLSFCARNKHWQRINAYLTLLKGNLSFTLEKISKTYWSSIINSLGEVFLKYNINQNDPRLSDDNRLWLMALLNDKRDILVPANVKIKLAGITIFKIKTKKITKGYYLLGIPIWKKTLK